MTKSGMEHDCPLLRRKRPKLPFVDRKGSLNVETRGAPKHSLYWGDLFHTLVNILESLRKGFHTSYLWMTTRINAQPKVYARALLHVHNSIRGFAAPYYYDAYNNLCIPGVQHFSHALWFSVQTSMTIGYGGELTPDPRCMMTNIMVVLQSLVSLLVAYSLLGVFYIRFARPARRARTLIFSKHMVMYEEDGVPVLAFRMANVRKHQIIEANVRVLIGLNNHLTDEDESIFHFTQLPIVGGSEVFLGLPYTGKHPITSTSPLYGLTLQDMEDADAEILVLLEGVDASTSSKLQARHSYLPSNIIREHRFETVVSRTQSGRRCVDFAKFDSVLPVTGNVLTRPGASVAPSPAVSSVQLPGIETWNSTFRSSYSLDPVVQVSSDILGTDDSAFVQSVPSIPASPERNAEGLDKLSRLKIEVPKRSSIHRNQKCLPRSMPDLFDTTQIHHGEDDVLHLKQQKTDLEHRLLCAEARAFTWKQMVVELASGIQQTLEQPSSAANAETGKLVRSARQALSVALQNN